MNASFWRGRRVLLTGHTGFKGTWLLRWLLFLGADVTGFALPGHAPSSDGGRVLPAGVHDVRGDVRDLEALRKVITDTEPEVVFHLAAQALVRESHDDPVTTFATNVIGTVNVLECLRSASSPKVAILVTSDKCYENHGRDHAFAEADRLGGDDPYGASKAAAELAIAAYRSSYGTVLPRVVSVRAGNVVGGGDWSKGRLVPDLVRAFRAGERARIRMPLATRPWQFVMDALHGYLLLAERGWTSALPPAVNFGPSPADARTVGWFADAMAARWGGTAAWKEEWGRHPHRDAPTLALDATLARNLLGWTPMLDAHEIVAWTTDWYRCEVDRTEDQLSRFTALATA